MIAKQRKPCPFTLEEYRALLIAARRHYRFCDYHDFTDRKSIIWRHDLEYSLHEMAKLARIDIEEGVPSIIFVQIRSPFYNAFTDYARRLFADWLKGGLKIGLHFDWEFYANDLARLEEHVQRDKDMLATMIEPTITMFSYHNPTPVILTYQDHMAGMVNAYHSSFFTGPGLRYISDSNGRWRDQNLREMIEDGGMDKLHVNLHDTWWTEDRISQIAKLENAWLDDAKWKMEFYRKTAAIIVDQVL
jgi:hypothetical protein